MSTRNISDPSARSQRGFTLTELAIATAVLLVGVVAVLQLIPEAMRTNMRNRHDTSSSVMAQRLRELFTRQALSDNMVVDPTGLLPCNAGGNCRFGDPGQNDRVVGSRVRRVLTPSGRVQDVQIDFTENPVANYSFLYVDPNDPSRTTYEVRWAVITSVRNVGALSNVVVAKRVIVGARRLGDASQSVSFNTLVVR